MEEAPLVNEDKHSNLTNVGQDLLSLGLLGLLAGLGFV